MYKYFCESILYSSFISLKDDGVDSNFFGK